jgi:glycosyltransferase involved in cell wall biosynthesis
VSASGSDVRAGARPAQVLTMIDSLLAGGAERVAVEIACGLDRARFTPHVVVTRHSGPLESSLREANVQVTLLGRTGRLSPSAVAHTWKLARESDLIHAHKFPSSVWGALLARAAGVPLVTHDHNWSAGRSRGRSLVNRAWIAPASHRMLCVSESVARALAADGVPSHRIEVAENGVHLDVPVERSAARRELGLDDSEFVVGAVAALRPEKSHELLLEAVSLLRADGREVRLCLVGSGPRAEELRGVAAGLGIEPHVVWAGQRRDAPGLVAAFDVAVICSRWEGLPLAALEALAAEVPLVATAVGGIPELLSDSAGFLVDYGEPDLLARSIATVMDEPGEARARARNGRLRVERRHGLEQTIQRVEAVYDQALHAGTAT